MRRFAGKLNAAACRRAVAIVVMLAVAPIGAASAEPAGQAQAAARPATEGSSVNLLMIHHSCGGQLLAAPGERVGGARGSGERCLYDSHPNGGGLRALLEAAGYRVNQASYESLIGNDTDICHWRAKFATHMDRILRTARQDALLPDGQTNRIVCFKSCYPNNGFESAGREPGDPDDCERTVANAKAAYRALLPLLRAQPDVLFVAFTAPPLAAPKPVGKRQKLMQWLKPDDRGARHARAFNTWLIDHEQGWLAGYDLPNVVVFDYYDILTGHGAAGDHAAYPTRGGHDDHPSSEGNLRAAAAFVPFLAEAVAHFEAGAR